MDSGGDDDSRGDTAMDADDALQAEVTATQTREKLNDALIKFWRAQLRDVSTMNPTLTELKNHPLPLARIKKIMKSDEDVRMISSEAPVLFAKACELFILELTHRAWAFSEANKRRTLQHNDVTAAILNHEHEVFEFLTDIFANEDGTIPEADTAAASLLAQHNPASIAAPSTSAGPSSAQQGGAQQAASSHSDQDPQHGQAMPAHHPGTSATGPQPGGTAQGHPQYAQYGQYAPWPGMQQGMPPQQQQQAMSAANMDPKMQEHLNQQMQLAQEQYMQRQMQQGHLSPGAGRPPS